MTKPDPSKKVPCLFSTDRSQLCGHKHCRDFRVLQSSSKRGSQQSRDANTKRKTSDDARQNGTSQALVVAAQRPLLPRPPDQQNLFDPFDALPVHSSKEVSESVKYFLGTWAPNMGSLHAFSDHASPFNSVVWPVAMQNKAMFEAFILLTPRSTFLTEMGKNPNEDPVYTANRGRVLRNVQNRLSNPSTRCDDITIWMSTSLAMSDYFSGNFEAAKAHTQGAKQMLMMRGPLQDVTPWQRLFKISMTLFRNYAMRVTMDDFDENELYEAIQFEAPASRTSSISRSIIEDDDQEPSPITKMQALDKLPEGLRVLAMSNDLSPQMVEELNHVGKMVHDTTTHEFLVDSFETASQLQVMFTDLEQRLSRKKTHVEHYVSCGLYAFVFTLLPQGPVALGYRSNARNVILDFIDRKLRPDDLIKDYMMWSYAMVACTHHLIFEIVPDTKACGIFKLEEALANLTWLELQTILKRFIWNDDSLDRCKEYWDEKQKER